MNLNEKAEMSMFIIEHALEKYERIFAACSFGKDSLIVATLALKVNPDIKFIGIDTGYEFPETLAYADELVNDLNMNFEWAKPSIEDVARIDEEYGESFIKNGQSKCCEMKLPAIEKYLPNYDAWITGLRRDETEGRKNVGLMEQGQRIKVNPIAFWTKEDVWKYIKDNNLKYHPLYDEGYQSLGCKPCTTGGLERSGGGRQGQFERAGN